MPCSGGGASFGSAYEHQPLALASNLSNLCCELSLEIIRVSYFASSDYCRTTADGESGSDQCPSRMHRPKRQRRLCAGLRRTPHPGPAAVDLCHAGTSAFPCRFNAIVTTSSTNDSSACRDLSLVDGRWRAIADAPPHELHSVSRATSLHRVTRQVHMVERFRQR